METWSAGPVVEAYQAMRGVALITAVTFVVEIGDVRRFDSAPQLMAYLGLVPSESSTGDRVRRGGITKAGNVRASRVLIKGAWTYRSPARNYAHCIVPGNLFLPKWANFPKILPNMRTDIDHLPAAKQRELERIVEILFDEFGQATENATGRRKGARILKIILFGSHARGDWVDAPLSANQYKSDYDILVIVSQKELTDRAAYWAKAEERLIRAYTIEKALRTPVNFIVHSLHEVNDGLAHGRVFFMEVAKDGIALYEVDDRELHTPKPKTPQQALAVAREYFDEWMPLATSSQKIFLFCRSQGEYRDAAFNLHQATERLYACLLLTLTYYSPYNHNIAFLRSLAEGLDRRLYGVWPDDNRRDRAMFQKLKEAYTKARYSKHYKISEEELDWLGARVEDLGYIVHQICSERVVTLEAAAST